MTTVASTSCRVGVRAPLAARSTTVARGTPLAAAPARATGALAASQHVDMKGDRCQATLDPDAVGQRRLRILILRGACATRRAGRQHAKPQTSFWGVVGVNPRAVGHGHAIEMQTQRVFDGSERRCGSLWSVGQLAVPVEAKGGNGMAVSSAPCKHPEVEWHGPPVKYASHYAPRDPIAWVGGC